MSDTMPTPQQIARAAEVAAHLAGLPHGQRGAYVQTAASELGVAPQTLHDWMRPHRGSARRRRADAHATLVARAEASPTEDAYISLTREEASLISATLVESGRANGKRLMSLEHAVTTLRHQGLIRAERVDPRTGEATPLSLSAIARLLRIYGMHPTQLAAPTPHQPVRTLHPNYRWEVDASVCVVYYLPGGGAEVRELDPSEHYKNKPQNLEAISQQRVIRYVVTDHTSGVVRWRYYPHAESGAHTVAFLAWAMAPKADAADPFHGAPLMLAADPGATASGTVERFLALCQVELVKTQPKNPRAKGSVEKAQDLVERSFEAGLRLQRHRVTDFASLNALAHVYQLWWNRTAVHRRHGLTRFDAWLRIQPDQLRITESETVLRALATEHPATPKVQGDLTVQYRGQLWDVRAIPGADIGAKLAVLWSPLLDASGRGQAVAVIVDPETGLTRYRPLPLLQRDDWGFRADAPVSGADYASMPDTRVDTVRKQLRKLASGSGTLEEDELSRKRKHFRPLAEVDEGRGVDPYRAAETSPTPAYLPRRGTHLAPVAVVVEPARLDLTAAAVRLAAMVRAGGGEWGTAQYAWLASRYPEGVPEDCLDALLSECLAPAAVTRPALAVVRG